MVTLDEYVWSYAVFYRERLRRHGIKPSVPEVLPLVREFYRIPGNLAGGKLHIVLDNGNVDDDSVGFCIREALEAGDTVAAELGQLLLVMSYTQRDKLYGSHPWGPVRYE